MSEVFLREEHDTVEGYLAIGRLRSFTDDEQEEFDDACHRMNVYKDINVAMQKLLKPSRRRKNG